jgi:hypothetical protein
MEVKEEETRDVGKKFRWISEPMVGNFRGGTKRTVASTLWLKSPGASIKAEMIISTPSTL